MTKVSCSYSIDSETISKLMEYATKKNISMSILVNQILSDFVKDIKLMDIVLIQCEKCNTKYSEKLNMCPNCAIKISQEAQEILNIQEEQKEKQIMDIHKRRNVIVEKLRQFRYTYNRLLIEDRGLEASEIKIQIEDLEKELANINNLIGV